MTQNISPYQTEHWTWSCTNLRSCVTWGSE